MIAVQEKPVHQVVLHNVSWQTYEALLDDVGESHLRITYDDGDLEIMTVSFGHEHFGRWIGRLIFFVALELSVPICSGGSTTLKQSLRRKGLEPDECFWIEHEAHMRNKKKWRPLIDPPPDLGVEVDVTSSSLDRMGIYEALQVPEIWRYDGETFQVLILGSNSKYKEKSKSLAFPTLPIDGLVRFVKKLGTIDEISLIQEFTVWLRTDVVSKKNGSTSRKNGKKHV